MKSLSPQPRYHCQGRHGVDCLECLLQILAYYKNAHDDLYPCVKGVVQELLSRNPGFKIAVTGHSLGEVSCLGKCDGSCTSLPGVIWDSFLFLCQKWSLVENDD